MKKLLIIAGFFFCTVFLFSFATETKNLEIGNENVSEFVEEYITVDANGFCMRCYNCFVNLNGTITCEYCVEIICPPILFER